MDEKRDFLDEKTQKNGEKIEKSEEIDKISKENSKISRTREYAVYAEKTKSEKEAVRGGRFGIRER